MPATGPFPSFIRKVSEHWGLSFIFTKIWGITFHPSRGNTALVESIWRVLQKYNDINNFSDFIAIKNNIYESLLSNSTSNVITNNIGEACKSFILANKISIPTERMNVAFPQSIPSANSGGFIQGRVGGGRKSDYNDLSITFLDTNQEFVDYIIKPWIIAVAHQGLIEDPTLENLKADIKCYFFAKSSPNAKIGINKERSSEFIHYPHYDGRENFTWASKSVNTQLSTFSENEPFLRKIITFRGCVPLSIPSKSYNYDSSMGIDEIMTNISFSYEWYDVQNCVLDDITFNPLDFQFVTEGKRTTLPNFDSNNNPSTGYIKENMV